MIKKDLSGCYHEVSIRKGVLHSTTHRTNQPLNPTTAPTHSIPLTPPNRKPISCMPFPTTTSQNNKAATVTSHNERHSWEWQAFSRPNWYISDISTVHSNNPSHNADKQCQLKELWQWGRGEDKFQTYADALRYGTKAQLTIPQRTQKERRHSSLTKCHPVLFPFGSYFRCGDKDCTRETCGNPIKCFRCRRFGHQARSCKTNESWRELSKSMHARHPQ